MDVYLDPLSQGCSEIWPIIKQVQASYPDKLLLNVIPMASPFHR